MSRNANGQRAGTDILFKVMVIIEPDGDGFHAFAPALPGLHTDGDTLAEAIENAKDAVEVHLRSMLKHGEPIPVGPDLTAEIPQTVPMGASQEMLTIPWQLIPQTCGVSSRV